MAAQAGVSTRTIQRAKGNVREEREGVTQDEPVTIDQVGDAPRKSAKNVEIEALKRRLDDAVQRAEIAESRVRELEAMASPEAATQFAESNSLREQNCG